MKYAEGMDRAFSPLRPDGRPARRFSKRFQNLWHPGTIDSEGMSIAGRGPRPKDASYPTAPPSLAAQTRNLPDPATFERPRTRGGREDKDNRGGEGRQVTSGTSGKEEGLKVARSRRGTLGDNVQLDRAAKIVGDVKRMATQTAVGMVHSVL